MESITITRPGEPTEEDDEQGNPVLGAPTTSTSTGWFIAGNNGGAEEATEYGTSDVARITIYNRAVVDVRAADQITARGRIWKVVGIVEPWASPWGSDLGGTAVTLERAG
jgi:hypothetical protein